MQFYNVDNQCVVIVQYNCETAVRRTYFLIKYPYTFILAMVVYGAESHAPQSGSRRMRRTLLAKWRGLCVGILRGRGRKPYEKDFNISL